MHPFCQHGGCAAHRPDPRTAASACHPHGRFRGSRPDGNHRDIDDMDDPFGGGAFGVRRPLRFLAHQLGLDEKQMSELARVLDDLKTERAQAEVDRRRSLSAFADSLAGEHFDDGKAGEAGRLRVHSAERLREAVVAALRRIHATLNAEQRQRLAYLIRTGTLAV